MPLALLLGVGVLLFLAYEAFGGGMQTSGNDFTTALANAIAKAEGTSPTANNPGSLTSGDVPAENITGTFNAAGVVVIDTLENGWNFLKAKLQNILDGNSNVYSPDLTIQQFSALYTTGDVNNSSPAVNNYAQSVADSLGVSTDTTLSDAEAAYNGGQ